MEANSWCIVGLNEEYSDDDYNNEGEVNKNEIISHVIHVDSSDSYDIAPCT